MWSEHLEKINSISEQLCSHVAMNIIMNLEDAHSTYSQSFHLVKKEIAKVGVMFIYVRYYFIILNGLFYF